MNDYLDELIGLVHTFEQRFYQNKTQCCIIPLAQYIILTLKAPRKNASENVVC